MSNRSMDPDTVQVMVRVVAEGMVNGKLENIGNRPTEISNFHGVKHKQKSQTYYSQY